MKTFNYFSRTLRTYFLSLLLVFSVAVCLLIFGLYSTINQSYYKDQLPTDVARKLVIKDELQLTADNRKLLDKNKVWLMLLDDKGEVEQSYRLPSKLKRTYSLVDIARSSRWYLDDYPIFTYAVGQKLLILGYPKDSYAKLPSNYFLIQNFYRLLRLALWIGLALLLLIFLIFLRSQWKLRKEFKPITQALADLSDNKPVLLDEKGNLSEIKSALNQTSQLLIENKDMRSHWIRGISHDLRNPLTLILGYTNQLETLQGSNKQTQQIEVNIHKMEHIIANLNMSYLLESQEIAQEMTSFDLNGLLRQIIADFYNNYPDLKLGFDLPTQATPVMGNKSLLTRAISNIILNSLTHNDSPNLTVKLSQTDGHALLSLADDGKINAETIAELNQKSRNYDTHGMGTLISKQIAELHHGKIQFSDNQPGLIVRIELPLSN